MARDSEKDIANQLNPAALRVIGGFFAWLALTPMIYAWGVLLIVLLVITLASFESQVGDAFSAIGAVVDHIISQFPFLERFLWDNPAVDDQGVIEINNNNIGEVVFSAYGYVAAPFIAVGIALDLVRGPRPLKPYGQKVKAVFKATLVTIGLFFLNFVFGASLWSGSFVIWAAMFVLGPGVVCLISLVSLSMHQLIAGLGERSNSELVS